MMQPALRSVMVIWLVLTVLFVFTYPLNTAGDAANYLAMILHRKSNLVHASGYPFVIGPLLRLIERLPTVAHAELLNPAAPFDAAQAATLLKIMLLQHAVHAAAVVGCALILLRSFGLLVALAVVVFWGMSTFVMSTVSTAYPEWLQADALFVTACFCAVGFFGDSNRRKVRAYIAAGATFGLAFLVKYNSLVLGVIFLALMLFETMPWRLRWLTAFGCAAAFVLVTGFHFFFFHYPSTRATSFHHDSGWVFMVRLGTAFGNDAIEGSSAINTLRYRALMRALPPDYNFARAFQNINDVAPPVVRAPHRAAYDRIMAMPRSELVEYIDGHPLPPTFMLSVSAIPIYHYVGLREGDDLATKVFLEFIRDNPSRFAAAVARAVAGSSITDTARPFVPLDPGAAGLRPTKVLASAHTEYAPIPPALPHTLTYWSPRLILWEPGRQLFKALHTWRPTPYLEFAAYLVVLAGIVFRQAEREKKFAAAILLALACFVVASNAVHPFRPKEVAAIWPMACLLWAIALKWAAGLASEVGGRMIARSSLAGVSSWRLKF